MSQNWKKDPLTSVLFLSIPTRQESGNVASRAGRHLLTHSSRQNVWKKTEGIVLDNDPRSGFRIFLLMLQLSRGQNVKCSYSVLCASLVHWLTFSKLKSRLNLSTKNESLSVACFLWRTRRRLLPVSQMKTVQSNYSRSNVFRDFSLLFLSQRLLTLLYTLAYLNFSIIRRSFGVWGDFFDKPHVLQVLFREDLGVLVHWRRIRQTYETSESYYEGSAGAWRQAS